MKRFVLISLLLLACDHEGGSEPRRPRSPRSRTQVTCASDYECPGGACKREKRQTYGVCEWADGGGPDLERDAGSIPYEREPGEAPGPGIDIKPGPNDTHL